jgi:hypothetical protein
MNSESDIAFSADVAGTNFTASALFRMLHAGSSGAALQAVTLPKQAAPGGGFFGSAVSFSLGLDGKVGFLNSIIGSSFQQGIFLAREDGTLQKSISWGDTAPGGGVVRSLFMSQGLAGGDPGKFVFLSYLTGGSVREAIFVTAIPPGTASTTTTLSQLQSPAVAQQPFTLTAIVTSTAAGAPTGTVTFFANGISLGAGSLNSGGQAKLTTSSLVAGSESILAQYDGDTKFAPGNSSPMAVVVVGFGPTPASLTVPSGKSLVIPLTLFAPAGSTMNFSLSCSGLPANTTCMFDKNPVVPAPTGTMVQLTFTTKAGAIMPAVQPRRGTPALRNFGLATLIVGLFAGTILFWRQAPRLRFAFCACLGTLVLAIAIAGCGVTSYTPTTPVPVQGTPPGLTSFTVTGTSGTTTVSTVVNVTVQ